MASWTDLTLIQTPARIAALPKDQRGYPIPHTVLIQDGKPNFRVVDPEKAMHAVQEKLCGICGGKLGKYMAFVGGPRSIKSRCFTDLAMHSECASYALAVCPFLAMPKFSYLNVSDDKHHVNHLVSTNRPDTFGIGITTKYKVIELQGEMIIKAGSFTRVQFWTDGKPVGATRLREL